VGVTTLTLALVAGLVLNRLDDFFLQQERTSLANRADNVAAIVDVRVDLASGRSPIVSADNVVSPEVAAALDWGPFLQTLLADQIALADVEIVVGQIFLDGNGNVGVDGAANGSFSGELTREAQAGQTREDLSHTESYRLLNEGGFEYGLRVTLSDPYTFRASTVANVSALFLVIGAIGLAASVVVAAFLAGRFATPLRRLTEASRRMAQGDLSRRVSQAEASAGSAEIGELSRQFNKMAGRLEESMEIIRQDRDRSREFLADVSHELRTPIAALRTFIELLQGRAGDDPATRAEFLGSGAQQLSRLDWLAQNLLELSKLDSGLVLLELRPDDLRAAVESGAEQVGAAAERRGVRLDIRVPDQPVRIQHDAHRVGQIVSNLVGNAVKFTATGGEVVVSLRATPDGACIEVRDTGIGIDPDELPHIFERFYRGTGAAEARSTGSGLGLAIVKSIVDMHGGRLTVESRPGEGSVFSVLLPRDPRAVARTGQPAGAVGSEVQKTSPAGGPPLNGSSGTIGAGIGSDPGPIEPSAATDLPPR
jgi:signal transduction histidine kinase